MQLLINDLLCLILFNFKYINVSGSLLTGAIENDQLDGGCRTNEGKSVGRT